MMNPIGGIVRVAGRRFSFPDPRDGYGLIMLDGYWTLIEYSCPLESLPPQGSGSIVGQTFTLQVDHGEFTYNGQPVRVGEEWGNT